MVQIPILSSDATMLAIDIQNFQGEEYQSQASGALLAVRGMWKGQEEGEGTTRGIPGREGEFPRIIS